MFVAGIDAHATYSVIAIVSNTGQLVQEPVRINNTDEERFHKLFEPYRPLEVVVETSPAWPWLCDRLEGNGVHFVLAHAKRIRVIAESNYKSDDIDAELLARMRLAGLIPEVYAKCTRQREQAVLLRNRARLVRERTRMVNRIHAQVHNVGLHLERGRLLTQDGRQWVRTVAWPLLGEERRLFIDMQWALIDQIVPMIRTLDRRVEHVGREIPAVALLETVPGIGSYRALLIATETLPITRFRTPGHLVSYAGLAPRSSQSGLRPIRHGSIPAAANRWLRGTFVRAVVSHLAHAPGRVALLDMPVLRAQLIGLERRVARGGRDSVDHAPGGRDDVANAAAGALVNVLGPQQKRRRFSCYFQSMDEPQGTNSATRHRRRASGS